MSRRRSGRSGSGRRDVFPIANDQFSLPFPMRNTPISDYEDRRLFHPEPVPPARDIFGRPGRPPGVKNKSTQLSLKKVLSALQFNAPNEVLVCVRRKRRKEVLHALKKAGKKGQRKPRRNFYSDIHC